MKVLSSLCTSAVVSEFWEVGYAIPSVVERRLEHSKDGTCDFASVDCYEVIGFPQEIWDQPFH